MSKEISSTELHQAVKIFLISADKNRLFNFKQKLVNVSFTNLVSQLINSRFYYHEDKTLIDTDLLDAKKFLENAIPDCGSFSKGFFDLLTNSESVVNEQKPNADTRKLEAQVKEMQNYPYVIQLSIPGHQYCILVTEKKHDKPHGYVYQTNTHCVMGSEKFSIKNWLENKKYTLIDVLDHLEKVNILLKLRTPREIKKKIYLELYTIASFCKAKEPKNLDELISAFSAENTIKWDLKSVDVSHALKKFKNFYQSSIEEMSKLKKYFNIPPQGDFIDLFSSKLAQEEIKLTEDLDLDEALAGIQVSSPLSSGLFSDSIRVSSPIYPLVDVEEYKFVTVEC